VCVCVCGLWRPLSRETIENYTPVQRENFPVYYVVSGVPKKYVWNLYVC